MTESIGPLHVQKLKIRNSSSENLVLSLEPWADELMLSPGTAYDLVIESHQSGYSELVFDVKRITVFAWEGAVASVSREGTIVMACKIPVPTLPLSRLR